MRGFTFKLLLTISVAAVLFIGFSLAQEMNRRVQIHKEISGLEQEVRSMEKSVIEMKNLNQYFRTDSFAELMAREKLNYKAEGEKVVLIPENAGGGKKVVEAKDKVVQVSSIPLRWWNIFFVTSLLDGDDSVGSQ